MTKPCNECHVPKEVNTDNFRTEKFKTVDGFGNTCKKRDKIFYQFA